MKEFLKVAYWEGVSYLFLLFVAMPLKYLADLPIAVKVAGMIHGILFVVFCVYLFKLKMTNAINTKMSFVAFVLSLLPFGTFYLDKQLRNQKV